MDKLIIKKRSKGKDLKFKIITIGFEPYFINDLFRAIENKTEIEFIHGLVGEASRVEFARKAYPNLRFISLSKKAHEELPEPELSLLTSIESNGVPTIRSMIQGDRVLRFRDEKKSLGYATLLTKKIRSIIGQERPNLIMASHDSIHSGISLAVAKSMEIPWVAMVFPVLPEGLTGFSKGLTPNKIIPITRPVDDELRNTAQNIIVNVRSKKQKIVAYRAPLTISQWIRQYMSHFANLRRRRNSHEILGIDYLTYPTAYERMSDILRRTKNRLRLPSKYMIWNPPSDKYIYYPLHMAPESMLDTWATFYQNQIAFITQLSLAIPIDTRLLIKLHFSDPDNYNREQLRKLNDLPRLSIVHPNASGSDFIEKASLVIGIQGTSCLEAALLGKPVLIFGDSPYQYFPNTELAMKPEELFQQINRMLCRKKPTDEEIIEAYATYMSRYMPGRINDWTKPITSEDIIKLSKCFESLRKYVESNSNLNYWNEK